MPDENSQQPEDSQLGQKYWAEVEADKIIADYPNKENFAVASGISPSGVVHFGNVRDVMTSYAVAQVLRRRGKEVRFIFSWDDFDRLRKVPVGISAEFDKYIGAPLSQIPDPLAEFSSYADRFETEFETSAADMDIELEFILQTDAYRQGTYDDLIVLALQRRQEIGQILLSAMSDKAKSEKNINEAEYLANFWPIAVYSRFTGKDSTKVTDYDGQFAVTYTCLETGKSETIDIRNDHFVKLSWKIDWPMRWKFYDVAFEPGGLDHATPGSSYDVSSQIAEKIFGIKPPQFVGYQFIGIRGFKGKMSSSKGEAVSPATLLEIYEPVLLKWLYLRRNPDQSFSLAFDNEVYRQYDELDKEASEYRANSLPEARKLALELSLGESGETLPEKPIPFRQAVGLGQIVQWDEQKLLKLLELTGENFDEKSVRSRLFKARAWLENYNPDQAIVVRANVNAEYLSTLDESAKERIRALRQALTAENQTIEELNKLVYDTPKVAGADDKENATNQKAFFKDVYNLLISRDAGPRLSTFLWAVSRETVLSLLDV